MAKFYLSLLCVVLSAWKAASYVPDRCPDGFTNFMDGCYVYVEDPKNFNDAQAACGEDGGYLVEVNSAEENAFIMALRGNNGQRDWIGLEDAASDGVFTYASSGTAADYTNWNVGEPNNIDAVAEDCVEIWNDNGVWNDQNCGDVSNYFCERAACPEEWTYFDGGCYLFGPVTADFEEAKEICTMEGGYLAEIDSAEENAFLVDLRLEAGAEDAAFFGLTDKANEGTFLWVETDEAPVYTNWYQGEPNDATGEDCTEMWGTGVWNDIGCELKRDFFCEADL